ncbi:MAG: hypothetical protein ACPLPR_03520 [Bacillota bacterium]
MVLVTVFGDRQQVYGSGCCGYKSMEDRIKGFYFVRLYREFGQRQVHCRYIDVGDEDAKFFPGILQQIQRGTLRLPVVMVNDSVVLHGQFTSNELVDMVKRAIKGVG